MLSANDATPPPPEQRKSALADAASWVGGHDGRVSGYCALMEPAAVENNDPDTAAATAVMAAPVIAVPVITADDELLVEAISIDGMCGVY